MPTKPPRKSRTIRVKTLTRVEGEGSLFVKVSRGKVTDLRLQIFEPPRFFEAFLQGRSYHEVPDLVARICGICPVAYQMSAVHALEALFGVTIDPPIRDLRRLLYCGEWIESHSLHIHLLAAPDFLGYESALTMAEKHARELERGLRIKRAGNELLALLGGRSIHPVSACVGGFTRVPRREALVPLLESFRQAREEALEVVRWVASFPIPDRTRDVECVSLCHSREYPMNEGRIRSTGGLDLAAQEFAQAFEESQVPHSTALHCRIRGHGAYLVGPLARINLNQERFPQSVKEAVEATGIPFPNTNPATGIVARALEVLYAFDEAIRIMAHYEPPDRPAVPVTPRAGVGHGLTEAPRGSLYHRYEVDELGVIQAARIVPPTSQNQAWIEEDLRLLVPEILDLPKAEVARRCEALIRDYDPCISCATHFLKLHISHES